MDTRGLASTPPGGRARAERAAGSSVPAVARLLGVSVPRVHRLLDAEGVPAAGGRGRGRPVSRPIATRLVRRIGAVPVAPPGFDRVDMLVLAAVSRATLGLESTRAVARVAGVSPTAASGALDRLHARGLVVRRSRRIVQGTVRVVRLWLADLLHPSWTRDVLAAANAVVLPVRAERDAVRPRRVPPRFGHAFWNADLRALDVETDADVIASRLLQLDDAEAWAWAARHLPVESLRRAARGRGVDARRKALVDNLIAFGRAG